ncbi:MAG: glycosyltransferase family 39 protein [Chloroflexi bacterium]|nr:glycosyltransferase family 39 protein [Chloroflexota bacterium]
MPFPSSQKWSALFAVWILHGVIALWQFLSLPSEGLSIQRAVVLGLLLAWILFALILVVSTFQQSRWLNNLLNRLDEPTARDAIFIAAVLVLFARISLMFLFGLAAQSPEFRYAAYAERLSPFLDLLAFVAFEIAALNLFFVFRDRREYIDLFKSISTKLLIMLTLVGAVTIYIAKTDMGIAPIYKGDWARGLPAVPLLEWQILLAVIACIGMVLIEADGRLLKISRIDLWISIAIWIGTVGLWLSQPTVPNASALEPREPNYEIYPFIDAETYDKFAQSVLIGNGFGPNEIPQRPLYIVFLVLAHVFAGQNYENVITFQTLFYAMFPVLLYLFGREFFGRPVGISIALLAALRDFTSNLVSPITGNISYSKLYLSEIPTAISLILFLLIGIRWIKSNYPLYQGFLMGGILGVGMLNRTQVVVALPVLLFFAFILQPKKLLSIIKGSIPTIMIIVLVISPWLWRNWQMTGKIIFDNPASQTANLAMRYNRLNGEDVDILQKPDESNADYNDRMVAMANHAMSVNSKGIIRAIANSFINHGINNILLFPLRNDLASPSELWTPTTPFWQQWEGRPNPSQSILIAFYIFLFSLGVVVAWQRNGWIGLIPLAVNLAYNAWTSIALLSGQRFMLSMDWSIMMYYMIGIFSLISVLFFALETGRSKILKWYEANASPQIPISQNIKWQPYVFMGLIFFVVGASLPLSEMSFPKRYPAVQQNQPNDLSLLLSLGQADLGPECQKLIESNGLEMAKGRALYPRYYDAGDGEIFTDSAGYKKVDEGRLVFNILGQKHTRVIFPMSQSPDFFPNASDVTVWFDKNESPWFVLVEQGDSQRFYISDTACK